MSNLPIPTPSAPATRRNARWRQAARLALASAAVFSFCLGAPQASAAPYPARAVTVVSAFPPGGIVDIIARRIALGLSERLGHPFIVENKTGAAGSIGYAYAARANPDGYTLVLASGPTTMAPPNDSPLGWNPLTSFSAIGMIGTIPQAIVANPSVAAHDLREFIENARHQGGQINYGSPGLGTTPFFTMELLKSRQGIAMTHVAYRGQPDVMVDLMRGDLGITAVTVPLVVANVQKGKMKALAVTSKARVPALPEVPTVYEQGMPDLGISNWFALLGPAGLPPEVVARLAKTLDEVLATPQTQAGLAEIGLIAQTASPADTMTFVKSDLSRWIAMMAEVSAAETRSTAKGMK
jgi:tripartite-type tricarboxylate transporter receptor subunit TctC